MKNYNSNFHVMSFQLIIFLASILSAKAQLPPSANDPVKPNCQNTCGNLTIPFPFGIGPDCYHDKTFNITCKNNVAFLGASNIQVLNITLDGLIKVSSFISRSCYNESGVASHDNANAYLKTPTFPINSKLNKFTVIGCSTLAVIRGTSGLNYTTGCLTLCNSVDGVKNGSCSGIGCCQSSIPDGVRDFETAFNRRTNSTSSSVLRDFPCSFAFLVEETAYNFSTLDLNDLQGRKTVPVVLDWAVGHETCEEAVLNKTSYACASSNSDCIASSNGPGYRCGCSPGFEGNPYKVDGCTDIDECKRSPCISTATCKNIAGNFTCSCLEGYEGDGQTCNKKSEGSTYLSIALGISMSFLGLMVGGVLIYWMLAKRKLVKLREKFFQQNGGFMLLEQLSKHHGLAETARIFTAEDLKKATNNYDKSNIIGQGGFGTVYKGVLAPNNREVAIKKSKVSEQSQIEQFINEVIILSQINHRNVVKLIGCCLETEVPMLVYEFITNGTLSDHIHAKDIGFSSLSWEMRLKIAAETAGAIAYLHSAASPPIIHRDIKSTNILLDENYTAKVADFGASKLVPVDHTQLATLVQGTFGYMDPEYFHSSQLTEKSDVYSFGVLLAEILTGEQAVSFERPEKDRSLAMYFLSSVRTSDGMLEIVEKRLVEDGKVQQIREVVTLVTRCLRVKGEERPSMKEVAMELEGLKMMVEHPWVDKYTRSDYKETEYLLKQTVPSEAYAFEVDGSGSVCSSTSGFDSMRDQMARQLQLR